MSGDLGEFFSLIGKAKQEKEDEFRSLVGDIDIDSIFKEAKKSVEEDKKKKIKEEKQVKALEAWLYSEPKVEDKKEEVKSEPEEEVVEEAEDTLEIQDLHGNPKFEVIDIIKPEPLGKTKIAEEQTDIVEENDTIGKALNLLGKLKTKEEIQEETTDPEIIKIRGELEYLKNLVNAQGGGGEVRLEFLDDVDRDTAKVDGKFLKYQSSTGKWVGADASGGGGGSGGITIKEEGSNVGTAGSVTSVNFVGDNITASASGAGATITLSDTPQFDSLKVTGLTTFSGATTLESTNYLQLKDNTNIIGHNGVNNLFRFTDSLQFRGNSMFFQEYDGTEYLRMNSTTGLTLKRDGNTKLQIETDGITVTGTINDHTIPSGSGTFALTSDVPTNNNELTNGAGFITASDDITGTAAGLSGTPNISVGIVTATSAEFSGNVTIGGTLTYEDVSTIDAVGLITARSGIEFGLAGVGGTITESGDAEFAGIVTATRVHVGVDTGFFNEDLVVNGDARVTGILTVGSGSITLNPNTKQVTGIDEFIVGSGASISLAPFLTQKGRFEIDYSTINLRGYGSLSGTYNRQSTSFYLITAPSYSGSARFFNGGGYYYFLHESDNSKIIIYNSVDGYWSAIYSSGSDFSSPSVYQLVSPVTQSVFIHPYRTTLDGTGRLYPVATSGIEYATTIVGQTSLLGISTATTLKVTGVSTFQDNIHLGDGDRAYFGADNDLAIFHNSTSGNSVITALQDGNLNINATTHTFKNQTGTETKAVFNNNGSVDLYYDNSKKFETTNDGVVITGIATASSFVGSLTGSASSLSGVSSSFLLDYNNFTNTPTIPTNNNELTNGAGFVTFTNNNQLTNGAGYITTSFTNTNQLTNGAGFITNNVTGDLSVSGDVSVGGTLTYEDVKNVDSLGIVTARTGIDVLAGGINVTGVSTFNSDVSFDSNISGNVTIVSTDSGSSAGPELTLYRNSASPAQGDYLGQIMFKGENSNGGEENYAKITGKIRDETLGTEDGLIETAIKGNGSFTIVSRQRSDELQLLNGVGISVDGDSTFTGDITANGNIVGDDSTNISGINSVTATSFYGNGSNLTGVGSTDNIITGTAATFNNVVNVGTGITLDATSGIITATNFFGTTQGQVSYITATETLTNKTLRNPTFESGANSPEFLETRFVNATQQNFVQLYTGGSSGTYFTQGEYQKIATITPDGNNQNYTFNIRLTATSASNYQIVNFTGGLRANTLPDLDFTVNFSEEHNGVRFIEPKLWTKETTTAGFILAFEYVHSSNLYGGVNVEATIIPRSSAQRANVVFNTTQDSEQSSIDTGFTERDPTLTLSTVNGVPIFGTQFQFEGSTDNDFETTITSVDATADRTITFPDSSGTVALVGDEITISDGLISSGVTTTTTTSESSIDSFSASTYRSAKYQIQITQGSTYHTTEVSIVHDGSDSYGTEYGTIKTGSSLASFNTDISGGNVRLLATPASSSSTVFKLIRTLIEV